MNAVMNLWVSYSGKTLFYEISFLPVQEILLRSVRICCQGVAYLLSVSCVSAIQSGIDASVCFMFLESFKIC